MTNDSVRRFLAAADDPEAPDACRRFPAKIDEAERQGEGAMFGVIRTAAESGDWRAAAWVLERRFPERYGRRVEHRTEHRLDVRKELLMSILQDEDARRALDRLGVVLPREDGRSPVDAGQALRAPG